MSSTFRRLGQSELLPRYIFAESLYARRRVLEIGAVASTLGQSARFLSTRGARIVVAADSDLSAVQDAQSRLSTPSLRFRAPVFDDLETGSFDLVIVADLATYVLAPELVKDLVRLVAKNGYVMGGLRNPAGLALSNVMEPEGLDATPTYGQLLDALTPHFRSIEVATQSPVLGYQLAFEKGEGLQVDGSLAPAAEAAYYVVLAGHEPVRFFDPTWVQLPPEPLAFTGGKLEDASARARNWQERSDRLKDALNKSKDDVSRREIELKEIRAQLEGSKEVAARLTAQVESVTQRPQIIRQADELTQKIRRVEAELIVARERATDAEGRAQAMREEVALHQREQKNATVETLAAQEHARLERTRREQLASELEDARTRLTQAYEDTRKHQDDAAAQRIEAERARLASDRITEQLAQKNRELDTAREKELRLADARSESLQAVEALQGELKRARSAVDTAEEAARAREAEKIAAIRSLDLETQKHATVDRDLQNARARLDEVSSELREKEANLGAAETELQATKASATRLQRDIETLANSERTWREMAQQYESRLNDTLANVDALSEQVASLDAAKEQEVARLHRLEKDLATAVGAERSAREQAQAALADTQSKLREIEEDREKLLENRDELDGAISDLKKARTEDAAALESANSYRAAIDARVVELEKDLTALTGKLVDKVAEAEKLGRELESAQTYRTALDERLTQLEGEVHELTDRLADRSAAADRLSEELSEALDRAERSAGDVSERAKLAEERVTSLTAERDTARREVARITGQVEQGRQRVTELAQRSARLEAEVKGFKDRIGELEAQAKDRQERLQETQVKFTHAQKTAASLDKEQKEQLEALANQLQSAQKVAREEKERLEAQVVKADSKAEDAGKRQVEAQRDLETLRETLQATEGARARVEALLEGDRKELGAARTELESKLEDSRQQIQRLEARQDVLSNESKVLQHELEVQLKRYQELEERGEKALAAAEAERTAEREKAQRDLAEAKEAGEQSQQAAEGAAQQRLSVLQQEIEHFKADRLELEGRLTQAQQSAEHLDAQLAEGAELRAREVQLREKAEGERDALRAELNSAQAAAATANEWVVGGRTENEKLATQMRESAAEVARLQEELTTSRKSLEVTQTDLGTRTDEVATLQKTVAEREHEKMQLGDQLSQEKAESAIAKQQLEAAKGDLTRGGEDLAAVRSELDDLQKRIETLGAAHRDELGAKHSTHEQEVHAVKDQLESVKKELELAQSSIGRAQSEARGHQTGKLHLQRELDAVRGELNAAKASLAEVGGQTAAITEAKEAAQAELEALQKRAQVAEERAASAEGARDAMQAELGQARERQIGFEAEISAAKSSATGSAGELEAAIAARRDAEGQLVKLRVRHGELELQVKSELPQLREQVSELMTDNQMLDAERERLASQIERLETTRTQGADAEKELKHRIDMLQRRVNAQDSELNALRRRAGILPGGTASSAVSATPVGKLPTQPGTRPINEPKPSTPRPPPRVHTAVTPVMTPVTKPPPSPPKPVDDVELEMFELELDENGDDEEMLLLEDEASDPGPGTKKP